MPRQAAQYNPHGQAHPHEGACPGCFEERRCNVCGADTRRDSGRCTNGRCGSCHQVVCTFGGETSIGHGFGRPQDAVRRHREVHGA